MMVSDLLTPESLVAFQAAKVTNENGKAIHSQFRKEQQEHLAAYPSLVKWRTAVESADFVTASDPSLLAALADDGFLIGDSNPSEARPDSAVFRFKLIAPRIVDAFLADDRMKVDYALNSLQVCFRRADIPGSVLIPEEWRNTILVDCEVFELPYGVAADNFDDREKVHVYYLAGMHDDRFRAEPVYIGIGTGEAYGVGPANRTSRGRFRFYRYDIKDDFQVEYIARRIVREWTQEDVADLPGGAKIDDREATLLLGRGAADTGFMVLSDPFVAEGYRVWIGDNPHNQLVFQLLELRQVHEDLAPRSCEPPTPQGRLETALALAEEVHRYFFSAWQHPRHLTDAEGLNPYYLELPEFRRKQYEIYRIKPGLLGPATPADGMTIPEVLFDRDRCAALEQAVSGAVRRLDAWFRPQLVQDLYDYGNHPEQRLCSALVFMRLLRGNGAWASAIRAAYDLRLNYLDMSVPRLTSRAS